MRSTAVRLLSCAALLVAAERKPAALHLVIAADHEESRAGPPLVVFFEPLGSEPHSTEEPARLAVSPRPRVGPPRVSLTRIRATRTHTGRVPEPGAQYDLGVCRHGPPLAASCGERPTHVVAHTTRDHRTTKRGHPRRGAGH